MALEITHLVLGLTEAQVLDVSSQKEFNERQEVGLFREKHSTDRAQASSEREQLRLGSFEPGRLA